MTKLCVICGKPLVGSQRKLCSDRECHKERWRKRSHNYYHNNLEREKKRNRKRYLNNQEKMREYSRKYYWDNQEKRKEYSREYYHNNREKILERAKEYRQNNLEKVTGHERKYRQNNLEKESERGCKHYRRIRGLPEDWGLSRESSIEAIMKRWLQDSNIEFTEQHYINLKAFGANWTRVDFFIEPNICLYSDGGIGNYYHGTKDIQERDTRINRALETGGHVVIRLSESDILAGVRPIEILELIQ